MLEGTERGGRILQPLACKIHHLQKILLDIRRIMFAQQFIVVFGFAKARRCLRSIAARATAASGD